jgi:hypothetical protein
MPGPLYPIPYTTKTGGASAAKAGIEVQKNENKAKVKKRNTGRPAVRSLIISKP